MYVKDKNGRRRHTLTFIDKVSNMKNKCVNRPQVVGSNCLIWLRLRWCGFYNSVFYPFSLKQTENLYGVCANLQFMELFVK